ncbi:MAG: carboxypeptidase-like regulatory domain-containing protein, partial [Bacteroidetes bacterium]|nr:carboxypeptidase-like regulatory domain-containing protein [Bacteroidota bacterium]
MKYNLSPFILFLFTFFSITATAQNFAISGTIRDGSNGEELLGASVAVKELPGTGAITNAYGFYSLTLPKGQYTITARYLGFADSSVTVTLESNKQINFSLGSASTTLK